MKHIIIGTAGHIDHGKTTLIKALTGRDTDTLKEEKERGISINLGFTYFDLPSGKRAGIVDVPGHERFIKNMLAGASGIDMVLLVIAADEGVMPQTREHLNILSLLDVKNGIVVITKKDMVDDEWLEVVMDDIQGCLKGTFLEGAAMVPVSSVTREGINELIKQIDDMSENIAEKSSGSSFRLPVDRVFTISGFGTVVTGTLISGNISEGDRAQIYPSGLDTKVRSIQVHEQPVKSACAGQRVAVNLSNVKVDEVDRGDVVAEPGCMEPSLMIDCRLNYLKDAEKPLENRDRVRIYHGTSELLGRVYVLDKEILNPGDAAVVQIRLESMISAQRGDKYVIRSYSPMITIGGGTIIDPNPPKRKRFDKKAIDELITKEKGDPAEIIEQVVLKNSKLFPNAALVSKLAGGKDSNTRQILESLKLQNRIAGFDSSDGTCYVHMSFIDEKSSQILDYLKQFHGKNPLKSGMAKEEIKSRLFEGNVKQKIFDDLLALLEGRKIIKVRGKYVSLYDFEIELSSSQREIKNKMEKIYSEAGINVPKPEDAITYLGGDVSDVKAVFDLMIDNGELIKINEDMVISKDSYNYAVNAIKDFLNKNGEITLAQYRDLLDTSRKYAVSLLEYFDQAKITRRKGDTRVLF